ncbi:MAG: PQQ-binding-like beta-propeller repeat protein [Deltaproteobacteria bacterium]|nr:PQQ-binding-like beta-propeller repeat protein [Deltaproteobacteria bacterium]
MRKFLWHIHALVALGLVGGVGCAPTTGDDGKIIATINLGSGFDTAAITGLVLILDAPGDAGLSLTTLDPREQSRGGHTYTSEVKDCDGDGRAEFCVTFAENPFSAGTYQFTFSGRWPESVLLSLRVVVLLQNGKQESATKEQFDDGTSLRFVARQSKAVTVGVPCRVGYSCAGTIDTTPPGAPVGTGVTPQSPANYNSPIVYGTAEANTTIQIFAGDATCTTTPTTGTVNAAGQFAVIVTVSDNTSTIFYGRVVDSGENVSLCTALNALPYVEDSAAPPMPDAPDLDATSDTGVSNSDNVTQATTPTFTGMSEASAIISLYHSDAGATPVGSAFANDAGVYTVTSVQLTDGPYTFTVKARDSAGNASDASVGLVVTIDTTKPSTPNAPDLDPASDTGASNTDNITGDTTPTFIGTTEANATVRLYSGSVLVGTTNADGVGAYAVTASTLEEGDHLFSVRAVDRAGNESLASPALSVAIDSLVNCPPVSAISRLVPNGSVYAMARSGCTIFLGGYFTRVTNRPTGSGAHLSGSTAELAVATPLAIDDGGVFAVVSDDAGGWYIGGAFNSVGATPRNRLARLNADGTLHSWNPNANATVRALVERDGIVYAGGDFTYIDAGGGAARNYLAAFDVDGGLLAWNPNANDTVHALAVSDGVVYVGGAFTAIDGGTRNRLAAVDTDGGLRDWNPNASDTVQALAVSDGVVYAGGAFSSIGGTGRTRLAAIDTDGGLLPWSQSPNGIVYALAIRSGVVYVGGAFYSVGASDRGHIAAVDTDGGLLAWNPGLPSASNWGVYAIAVSGSTVYAGGTFWDIYGSTRDKLVAIDADGGVLAWAPEFDKDFNAGVYALGVSGSSVYVGGTFHTMGGTPRKNLAAIDLDAGLLPWNPSASGPGTSSVYALAVSGGTVFVGGGFTKLGDAGRSNLGAIDFDGGILAWNPVANAAVSALAVSDGTLYVAGQFTAVGGATRHALAALDFDGGLLPWNPNPIVTGGRYGYALAVSESTIFAGGQYTTIGTAVRNNLGAIDAVGGVLDWNPNANYSISALAVSGGTIYVGGNFTTMGGETRNRLAAFSVDGGQLFSFNPSADNLVGALAARGGTLFVGGGFTSIGGEARNRLAAFDVVSGQILSWNPNANEYVNALLASTVTVYAGGLFTTIGGALQPYLAPLSAATGSVE